MTVDGDTAYVALAGAGQAAVLDLKSQQVTAKIDVGRWPRYLALSPDGSRLAVGVSGEKGAAMIDTAERKLLYVGKFGGLNIGHMATSADGEHVHFAWMTYRATAISASNMSRIDSKSSRRRFARQNQRFSGSICRWLA